MVKNILERIGYGEKISWKTWIKFRLTVLFTLAVIFVIAFIVAGLLAGQKNRQISSERDTRTRITETDLQTAAQNITAAYATLPSDLPVTYTDAVDTCTENVDGRPRIICFKDNAYARLKISSVASKGLTTADLLASKFQQAGWEKQRYFVMKDGKTQDRETYQGEAVTSMQLNYRSPPINKEKYCTGFIYIAGEKTPWSGTIRKC